MQNHFEFIQFLREGLQLFVTKIWERRMFSTKIRSLFRSLS